jgi:hypothetical protein
VPQQLSRRGALAGFGGAAAALAVAACGRVTADASATAVAAARRPAGTLLWQSQAAPADQPYIVAALARRE